MTQQTQHEKLDVAIRRFPPRKGDYLVGWVVVGEWLSVDGERSLGSISSDGMTPWQRTGYLTDVLNYEEE